MKKLVYSFLLLFVTFSSIVCAQEDKLFKNFGINNPIAYQFVMSITQDKHGFMWFGAEEGLHRFDGHQLLSFHHDKNLKNSLSSNVISRILTDSRQRLWVGTRDGGLNLYRESTQDFFHITSKTASSPISNDTVNILFEDSSGQLWIGTDNGLNILTLENETWQIKQIFQELGQPNSLSHNIIHAITESNDNLIWVGTNGGGISVFDLSGRFIKTVKYGDSDKSDYTNKFINSLFTDKQGIIWIGTVDNGLLRFDPETENFEHFLFNASDSSTVSSNTINNISQDSNGSIWVATDNGLSIYKKNSNRFFRHNHTANNPYSLSNDYIITFFEDKNEMMWIGTFTGVNRWDPTMTTFSQFTGKSYPDLVSQNITSFTEFNNESTIFSTYSGGIYQLEHTTNTISRFNFNGYFNELRIMSLFADKQFLWVGTRASGLHRIDMESKEITVYQHDENNNASISANSVTDIIRDKVGRLWVSTFYQGLNLFHTDGTFTRFSQNENQPSKGPSNNYILHLLEDDAGYLWLATYGGGINRFSPESNTFLHIKHDENNPESLSSDLAWYMLIDGDNNLWVSTQAAGLNVLSYENRKNKKFTFQHFNTQDGMRSQTAYGMTQDAYGDIWLSTNKGVSRYSLAQEKFKHFDLSHGLVDLDYNHGAIFKNKNNVIYFGAGKGFSTVEPEKSNSSIQAPEVRLTNVLKLNEAITFESPIAELSLLNLSYTDQLVSFEYVGLNYTSPDSTQYKYRLLGFDQEWIDAGKSRRATYTNLPQGNYQLQIIAGNNENVWSEAYKLDISMQPAPWNTWWAYIVYTIIIALAILSYTRLINRKLIIEQQQKNYLKQQVEEKTEEFLSKNLELEFANKQLEKAAIVDKVTGIKSRRYLDIYIEQASQLMNQIHQNLLPVQRSILPRLYVLMVKIDKVSSVSNSQLVNLTDLLLYSRNNDDLLIRWSADTFAIIGYEKDNNAGELASRIINRSDSIFDSKKPVNIAYAYYPFNREQPLELSWDQVSVLIELGIKIVSHDENIQWLGLYEPKEQPFDFLSVLKIDNVNELDKSVVLKAQ